MKHPLTLAASLLALSLLNACAGKVPLLKSSSSAKSVESAYPTIERPVPGCAEGEKTFDCDRRAILAMLGGYEVQFKFDETVILQPGYKRSEPKRSMGFEFVLLVEDTGRKISLQHILVMGVAQSPSTGARTGSMKHRRAGSTRATSGSNNKSVILLKYREHGHNWFMK